MNNQMLELFKQNFEKLKEFWSKIPQWQKVGSIAFAGVAIAGLLFIIGLSNEKQFGVLFNNLSEKDASAILTRLKEDGTDYKIENEGATLLVPQRLVYEKRLLFAAEGMPQSGSVGYEIFDKNNIGLTDFVQKINFKRALEGELARTIQSVEEVVSARVHIMLPESSLFVEDEKAATASIVINLAPGRTLKQSQVDGIANIVAGSVEGLEMSKVTILDSRGRTLSGYVEKNSLIELTSTQLQLQQKTESYFENKLTSLLAGILGNDKFHVRVTAELNFDKVERTVESFDPESSTIRSQQKDVQDNNDGTGTTAGASKAENMITNYEISKSVETVVAGVGDIKRLSVAAMIDGTYKEIVDANGANVLQYVPRSNDEMQKLLSMVKSAIGYDAQRNDQIQVEHIRFDNSESEKNRTYFEDSEFMALLLQWARRGSIVLAAVLLIIMIKKIFQNLQPPPLEEDEDDGRIDVEEFQFDPEVQIRIQKRQLVNELAKERPNDFGKLIRTWMKEEREQEFV